MAQGYSRQVNSVMQGSYFNAATINGVGQRCDVEFNALAKAFHQSIGHTHDGTYGQGPKLDGSKALGPNLPDTSNIATVLVTPEVKATDNHDLLLHGQPNATGSVQIGEGFSIFSGGSATGGPLKINGTLSTSSAAGYGIVFQSDPVGVTTPTMYGVLKIRGNGTAGTAFSIGNLCNKVGLAYVTVLGEVATFTLTDTYLGYYAVDGGAETLHLSNVASQVNSVIITGSITAVNAKVGVTGNANLCLGTGAALATNATINHVMIPTCAGKPTGTPVNSIGGQAAILLDTTNHKLCLYDPIAAAWYGVVLTAL